MKPPSATTASANWIGQTIALEAEAAGCNGCNYGLEYPAEYDQPALPLDAAYSAITAQNAIHPAQGAIILLSDGDANIGGTNQCQAGIAAAENAEQNGVLVYVIAYGARCSGGCTTDTSHYSSTVDYDRTDGLTPNAP